MISKLLILMPSPWAQLQSVKGKDFKICSCSLVGGAQSLPDPISAFPLMVSPCNIQLKDQMSSSTNNLLHGLSDNCYVCKWHTAAAQNLGTRCSFLYNCTIWWREGHTEMAYVWEAWIRIQWFFLKASQALSTGYSTLLKHWILTANLLSSQWKKMYL